MAQITWKVLKPAVILKTPYIRGNLFEKQQTSTRVVWPQINEEKEYTWRAWWSHLMEKEAYVKRRNKPCLQVEVKGSIRSVSTEVYV